MAASHRDSVLAASCIRTPVNPRTRAPLTLYEREEEDRLRGSMEQPGRDDLDSYSDTEGEQSSKDWIVEVSKIHHSDTEYYMQLERLKNVHALNMEQLEKMYDNKLHLHGVQDTQPVTRTDYWFQWEQKSSQPTECECCFLEHNVSSSGLSSSSSLGDLSDRDDGSDTYDSISVREKIDQMWDGFSVEDYISKTDFGKHRAKHKAKSRGWSHRVTVPQPFEMTIRESKKKEMNVKSKSEIEMENNMLKKRLEEEAECQKKFRANPVPASVYLPLYHEIVERNEERRNFVKERSKEILLASQKPFLFIDREERKKQDKKMQLRDLPDNGQCVKLFKAKPVPESIYGTSANERLKEDELYRQIRIHMRSQELLHSSSYPTSTLAGTTRVRRSKTRRQEHENKPSHRPKINTQIPNFKVLHENHQKHLLKNKDVKHVTICDPFHLRTSSIPSNKGKILKDIETDEEMLNETRWPYKSPRNQTWKNSAGLSPREEAPVIAPRSTESSKRREQAIRKSEKQRSKEYKQELDAMKERVSQTPLLLERASQRNARLCAEKHYSTVLRDLGLSDDFVSVKGRSAALRGPEHTKDNLLSIDDDERSSEGTLEIEDLHDHVEDDEIQRNQSEDEKYGEYSSDEDHIEEEL
ncbi:protein FAM161A isoform X2 [Engystomops pustulosus]|uniref:protein FAM161A isoform X2 n=1 Tax=Engystomops pustulosus TaxID=76066 RepID=UPI003AFADC7A